MKAFSQIALTLCYLSVAVTIISLFIPQKRTRKIFGFVIGLFVIASLLMCLKNTSVHLNDTLTDTDEISVPEYSEEDYKDAVLQSTAENLVTATDELLRAEDIAADDIQLSLKISDEGRIYVHDVVIYIDEEDLPRKADVENIVYRNLSKEPRVYVAKEEVQ